MGDFASLDDVMTENPRVVQGFIEVLATGSTSTALTGFASIPRSM
jgi:hypothetical protein